MSERRIDIEDLGEIAALAPDDPRRIAFEARPGARARLRAFEAFMTAESDATPAQRTEADARLGELLEREVGVTIEMARATDSSAGAARRGGAAPARGSWLAWLWTPSLRPVFAMAAFLVVVTLGVSLGRWYGDSQEPVYRGGPSQVVPGAWDAGLAMHSATTGRVRLAWTPAPGADAYTVVFMSAQLLEIARVENVRATELEMAPNALPAGLVPGAEVLVRVIAFHGADEVGSSRTLSATLP